MEFQYLLSDEFVKFSEEIKELHKVKNDLNEAFKATLSEYKKNVKEVEEKANALQQEFNAWQEKKMAETTKQPSPN